MYANALLPGYRVCIAVMKADCPSDIETLSTVRDFIRWGASRMNQAGLHFGHGTADAIDDAAALVLHALHLPGDLHSEYFSAMLTIEERQTVWQLLMRRVEERIPSAYLTGQSWFMGLPFYVDPRVLIPRSPIAELIEHRFSPWLSDPDAVTGIVDIGTGSGCIGIACAYAFPDAEVDLVDLSTDALEVAQRNIDEHGLGERVRAVHSDLFSALAGRRYDVIVSNPPYVSREEMAGLPAEYRHEPQMALACGEDGLDIVHVLLGQALDFLTEHGVLIIEVGASEPALRAAYPEVPFTWAEFERGGDGVLVMTAEQLREFQDRFDRHSRE